MAVETGQRRSFGLANNCWGGRKKKKCVPTCTRIKDIKKQKPEIHTVKKKILLNEWQLWLTEILKKKYSSTV